MRIAIEVLTARGAAEDQRRPILAPARIERRGRNRDLQQVEETIAGVGNGQLGGLATCNLHRRENWLVKRKTGKPALRVIRPPLVLLDGDRGDRGDRGRGVPMG